MSKLLTLAVLMVKPQVSMPMIVNALVIAGITAAVTSWATVQRVDKRMDEVIHDMRKMSERVDTIALKQATAIGEAGATHDNLHKRLERLEKPRL